MTVLQAARTATLEVSKGGNREIRELYNISPQSSENKKLNDDHSADRIYGKRQTYQYEIIRDKI